MSADPQEIFASQLVEIMSSCREEWSFLYDSDEFTIEALDKNGTRQAVVRLDKLFTKYLSANSEEKRQKVLLDFSKLIVSTGTPETFEEAKKDLMPLIKDRWYVEVLNVTEKIAVADGKSDGSMILPSYNLSDEVSIILSYEMPNVRSLITNGKLKSWETSFIDGMNHAVESMRSKTAPKCNAMVYQGESRPYAYVSSWEDGSDASRVLLEDVMLSFPVLGELIVCMPHAGELVVTGTDETHGLELLLERCTVAYQSESRYLPPIPFVWKEGILSHYDIPENHCVYRAFEALRHLWLQDIYGQQKKMLSTEWVSLTDGLHVAQYELLEKEAHGGNVMVSNCTVSDMNAVLVPQTDLITFCELDTEGLHTRAVGTWDEVTAILGSDLIETDLYPKLYRVSRFPTASELRAIRAG